MKFQLKKKIMLTSWVKRELTRFSSSSMLMSENQQGSCCWCTAIGKGLEVLGFLAGLHMTTELCGQLVHDKVNFRFHGVTLFRNTEMYKIEVDCFVCMLACWVASVMSNSVTLWTVACQAPLSMWFSRQESWRFLPFPSRPGADPTSLALAGGFFTTR